ncbi:hypothetical protein Metvu_0358 [Methanocaldococcus vulcanius M7]|uniref:Uncharacterized protein n=1 Tax=Methanocaldococcus vulcanius (strain ATCC 700851 / DSM 12094 / M7) TaxID=579137 RepID=C9RF71_METVM|nr:hypothetical protein [Methanocaldococcus vulcanius]ACX72223.1 hypothetical protein Metvu_0358 [Methanocaldococcus vulcanius M7]
MKNKKIVGEVLWTITVVVAVINAYLIWNNYIDVNMLLNLTIIAMVVIVGHLIHPKHK